MDSQNEIVEDSDLSEETSYWVRIGQKPHLPLAYFS